MSTPRQIKASEVVTGMRVRVEREHPASGPRQPYTVVFEGIVSEARTTHFTVGDTPVNDYTFWTFWHDSSDRLTVTVLADPEPEWVEGAWYRLQVNGNETIARRVEGGWVRWGHVSIPSWEDSDLGRNITVLGRVLIVDWPGDDVARDLANWPNGSVALRHVDKAADIVTDAIRTQGGAR